MPEHHSDCDWIANYRYHGDQAVEPGMLDFAVNVREGAPPDWVMQRLAARMTDLAGYPGPADYARAVGAVAARHGRRNDEVALLAGASEGFALLADLGVRRAALIAPSFTEPAAALAAAGVPFGHIVLPAPFHLAGARVPSDADLVVIGNPTNPTSVLHSREEILAMRRPGRILVVDEAFVDAIPGERESVAGDSLPDVIVLRSLTKTWSLAGLRVGYALGAPQVLSRLTARRARWPLGTLQLEAIAACCSAEAVADADAASLRLARMRDEFVSALVALGLEVVGGVAPFVLCAVPDAVQVRKSLRERGISIRRCDTFVGLGQNFIRVAVRREWPVLVEALCKALNE